MDEVKPPWVMYPGYPPMDTFWRQPGEAWFVYVWEPYWQSLSEEKQGLSAEALAEEEDVSEKMGCSPCLEGLLF